MGMLTKSVKNKCAFILGPSYLSEKWKQKHGRVYIMGRATVLRVVDQAVEFIKIY